MDISEIRGKRILDLGCGTGEITCFLARQGAQVVGMDLAFPALEYGRRLAVSYKQDNTRFVCGSLHNMPFPHSTFDYVVAYMVLHQAPHPAGALRSLADTLTPGGRVIVQVPCFFGHLRPFHKAAIWKSWAARVVGAGDPDRTARAAESLFYRHGDEAESGMDRLTYLYNHFAVPKSSMLNTHGRVLKWLSQAGLRYVSSDPPIEVDRLVKPFLMDGRKSASMRGRLLRGVAKSLFSALPLLEAPVLRRPSVPACILSQILLLPMDGIMTFTVLGEKVS
jgi:SAM-dependent methyltransferase